MKVVFANGEAKIETRKDRLAILPWLYNTVAVDHRLKELGLRRHGKWKKLAHGDEAPIIIERDR